MLPLARWQRLLAKCQHRDAHFVESLFDEISVRLCDDNEEEEGAQDTQALLANARNSKVVWLLCKVAAELGSHLNIRLCSKAVAIVALLPTKANKRLPTSCYFVSSAMAERGICSLLQLTQRCVSILYHSNSNRNIDSSSNSKESLPPLSSSSFSSFSQSSIVWLLVDVLRAFSCLCYYHAHRCTLTLFNRAVDVLTSVHRGAVDALQSSSMHFSVGRAAIASVGALCVRVPARAHAAMPAACALVLDYAHAYTNVGDSLSRSARVRALATGLRALRRVLAQDARALPALDLGTLLGELKALVFDRPSPPPRQKRRARPSKRIGASSPSSSSSSSSAPSDLEDGGAFSSSSAAEPHFFAISAAPSTATPAWKVRLYALHCIDAIVRTRQKQFFGHWDLLLAPLDEHAESSNADSQAPLLYDAMRGDSSISVRIAAATLLGTIAERSAPLLVAADGRGKRPTTFVPFSARLASMLCRMHAECFDALRVERDQSVRTAIFKSLAALIANAPYARLDVAIVPRLVDTVVAELKLDGSGGGDDEGDGRDDVVADEHAEQQRTMAPITRRCAAACLTALLNVTPPIDYVANDVVLASDLVPRIVATVARGVDAPHALELCASLGAVARANPLAFLRRHWPSLFELAINSLQWPSALLRIAALQHIVQAGTRHLLIAAAKEEEHDDFASPLEALWQRMFASPLPPLVVDEEREPRVRAAMAATLAQVPAAVFARLNRSAQLTCVTLALAGARDDNASVRSAAFRTIGVLVALLGDDTQFMVDAAAALVDGVRAERSDAARERACWSLANLCDAIANRRAFDFDAMPPSLWSDLGDALLGGGGANVVRALGHFAHASPRSWLLEHADTGRRLVDTLLAACTARGPTKARWNACYALGAAFQSGGTLLELAECNAALLKLADIARADANFKVRINALAALSSPSADALDASVRQRIVATLRTIDESATPNSAAAKRYQSALLKQLSETIAHLDS
jgi:Domain of unknown function (DUF4042)